MENTVNDQSCPFCKYLNSCMVNDKNPCWCNNVEIPTELIALVPEYLQQKSCICLSCINHFNANPEFFKNQYKSII
jgi:hypothetical protein